MPRIDRRLLYPPVQHRLVTVEIARRLRDTDTAFANPSSPLDLELTPELATLQGAHPASPSHLNQVSVKSAEGHKAGQVAGFFVSALWALAVYPFDPSFDRSEALAK